MKTCQNVWHTRPRVRDLPRRQGLRLNYPAGGGWATRFSYTFYGGRNYRGLMRHVVLCQLVMLFLAEETARLRGEQSAADACLRAAQAGWSSPRVLSRRSAAAGTMGAAGDPHRPPPSP